MMKNDIPFGDYDSKHCGVRLMKLELLNWGGCDSEPATLDFDGAPLLLTGLNGVGKTTILDAITTLFSQRPRFEQANSGEKERSIASYCAGQHKYLQKDDEKYGAKIIHALRNNGKNSPVSIVLATFSDKCDNEFTALQVFHFSGKMLSNGKFVRPERTPVIIPRLITISEIVGLKMQSHEQPKNYNELMQRIKSIPGADVSGSLEEYLKKLCKRLGVSMKGLKAIADTVSLKSVDDIDAFIRDYMLDPTDFSKNLEDINDVARQIREIKQKIEDDDKRISILAPVLEKEGAMFRAAEELEKEIIGVAETFDDWFSIQKHQLAQVELEKAETAIEQLQKSSEAVRRSLAREEHRRDEIKISLANNGGDKIELYKDKIETCTAKLKDCLARKGKLEKAVGVLKKQMPVDENSFDLLLNDSGNLQQDYLAQKQKCEDDNYNFRNRVSNLSEQINALDEEIAGLKKQKGNIPLRLATTRDKIAQTLNIDKASLPFIGELLDVPEKESAWEGAINNLLHSFSTIVLVPANLCQDVSHIVDKMSGIKIKYEKINDTSSYTKNLVSDDSDSVVGKLLIKTDAPMTKWLTERLLKKFPHKCCLSRDSFEQESYALTRSGLHKEKTSYAKDDTKPISDPRNYTLGFSNDRKIKAKEVELQNLRDEKASIVNKQQNLANKCKYIEKALRSIDEILSCKRWKDIDTDSIEHDIDEYRNLIDKISNANNYQALNADLEKTESNILNYRSKIEDLVGKKTVEENKAIAFKNVIRSPLPVSNVDAFDAFAHKEWNRPMKYDSLESMREFLIAKIRRQKDEAARNVAMAQSALEEKLSAYTHEFPHDNMTPSCRWLHEFDEKLRALIADKIETNKDFDRLCRDDFNAKILGFKSDLDAAYAQIAATIDEKNLYLKTIPFRTVGGEPVYIRLKYSDSEYADVKEFRSNLSKAIYVADGKNDSPKMIAQREAAFRVIEQFVAETKADKDSRDRILDVRHWRRYAAQLEFADGRQQAYYDSSSGDSTGQKKAMASFLFAISRLQTSNKYGDGVNDSGFRFIMMDETNEHCDPKTGDSVLQCLKKFDFQSFFVTAKERVAEITPYVKNVYEVIHDTERGEGYTRLVPCKKGGSHAR